MCHTEAVPAMSTPSLSDHLVLVAADPTLAGHPVVAGLVVAVDAQATELAALLWDFIAIHPYDDGNGCLAHRLVNWMCVNAGYPPLVITLEQRDDYLGTLSGMQTGNVPAEEAAVRPYGTSWRHVWPRAWTSLRP